MRYLRKPIVFLAVFAMLAAVVMATPSVEPDPGTPVERLSGANRFLTAVDVSRRIFPHDGSADAVIITRFDDFPDGLAGAPLAYAKNGPVLLTRPDRLHAGIQDEIERVLKSEGTIYVLGGEGVISRDVFELMEGLPGNYTVQRISGANRYETAVEIAGELVEAPETVFLVTGMGFADSLAVSSAAAILGAPILLTRPDRLSAATEAYLTANEDTLQNIYVIGGEGAVSAEVYQQVGGTERIWGANRYTTAVAIGQRFFPEARSFALASGLDFPDALTGGVLAAAADAPLLLSRGTTLSGAVLDYMDHRRDEAIPQPGLLTYKTDLMAEAQSVEYRDGYSLGQVFQHEQWEQFTLAVDAESLENAFILGGSGAISTAIQDQLEAILSEEVMDTSDVTLYREASPWGTLEYNPASGLWELNLSTVDMDPLPLGGKTLTATFRNAAGLERAVAMAADIVRYSTYAFSYEVPEDIIAGMDVVIPVTFATDVEGNLGYEGVRFHFSAAGPGTVTFKATDSNHDEHTFIDEGTWGPAPGFDLPPEYSATTDWTLNFSSSGSYFITYQLVEVGSGDIIAQDTEEIAVDDLKPGSFDFTVELGSLVFIVENIEDNAGNPMDFDDLDDFGFMPSLSTVRFYRGEDPGVTFTFEDLGLELGSGGTVSFETPSIPPAPGQEGLLEIAGIDLQDSGVEIHVTLVGTGWELEDTFNFPEDVRGALVAGLTPRPETVNAPSNDFLIVAMDMPLLDQVDVGSFSIDHDTKNFVIERIDIMYPPGGDEEYLMWLEIFLDTNAGPAMEATDDLAVTYTAAAAAAGSELKGMIFQLLVEDFSLAFLAPPDAGKLAAVVDVFAHPNRLEIMGEPGAVKPHALVKVYEAPVGPGPPGPQVGHAVTAEADGSFFFADHHDAHEEGNVYLVSQKVGELESGSSGVMAFATAPEQIWVEPFDVHLEVYDDVDIHMEQTFDVYLSQNTFADPLSPLHFQLGGVLAEADYDADLSVSQVERLDENHARITVSGTLNISQEDWDAVYDAGRGHLDGEIILTADGHSGDESLVANVWVQTPSDPIWVHPGHVHVPIYDGQEDVVFSQEFELGLGYETFEHTLAEGDFELGGLFAGLTLSDIAPDPEHPNHAFITVSGILNIDETAWDALDWQGEATITVQATGHTGDEQLTAVVYLSPPPPEIWAHPGHGHVPIYDGQEDVVFSQEFELGLGHETFEHALAEGDFELGGLFAGLTLSDIAPHPEHPNHAFITVSGVLNISQEEWDSMGWQGEATITVQASAHSGDEPLTAVIHVYPLPDPMIFPDRVFVLKDTDFPFQQDFHIGLETAETLESISPADIELGGVFAGLTVTRVERGLWGTVVSIEGILNLPDDDTGTVTVKASGHTGDQDITLEVAVMAVDTLVTLEGVVLDAGGDPLEDVHVSFFSLEWEDMVAEFFTAADGTFIMTLPAGEYFINCNHEEYFDGFQYVDASFDVAGIVISMHPLSSGGTIQGTVTDQHGQPLEGVMVSTDAGMQFRTMTGGDGQYFLFIPEGIREVYFGLDPYFHREENVVITAGETTTLDHQIIP